MNETKEQCEDMLSRIQDILRDDGRRVLVDRLYEVRTFITTLTRENERLREAMREVAVKRHGHSRWFCQFCSGRTTRREQTIDDLKHAPDCLAYGGER